jgi:hypothetical protein
MVRAGADLLAAAAANATAAGTGAAAAAAGAAGAVSYNRRFLEGLGKSIGVIGASEIGDKTFFIAAVMAMRHARLTVGRGDCALFAQGEGTTCSCVCVCLRMAHAPPGFLACRWNAAGGFPVWTGIDCAHLLMNALFLSHHPVKSTRTRSLPAPSWRLRS